MTAITPGRPSDPSPARRRHEPSPSSECQRPTGLLVEGAGPMAVADRPNHRLDQCANPDAAHVDDGGQGQGSAQTGHPQDRPVGLSEKYPAERKAAEGPGHTAGFGQGQGRRKGQGPGAERATGTARQPGR